MAIEKQRARRSFNQSASSYDDVAVLQREMTDRLLERLDYVRLQPECVLDIGCGTGYGLQALSERYPKAKLVGLDFAEKMLKKAAKTGKFWRRPSCLCADMEYLPLADNSVDLIVSNATFQWSIDRHRLFKECHRVLRPEGLIMFNTFGIDTLKELRQSWAQVDDLPHVHEFADLHDLGDEMLQASFADPVMDVEHLTLTYQSVAHLLKDLKAMGAVNADAKQSRGMTGKSALKQMTKAYEQFRNNDRLPATWEVVYGHGWKVATKKRSQESYVPVSSISLRQKR